SPTPSSSRCCASSWRTCGPSPRTEASALHLHAAGDEARAALVGDVGPEPVEQHRQPVAEADQERDVDGAPEQPGEPAAQLDETEIADRDLAPDGREIAGMPVAERCRRSGA